jgi:hypothetical protein
MTLSLPGTAVMPRDRRDGLHPLLVVLRDIGLPLVLTRLLLVAVTLAASEWRFAVPDPGRFLSQTPPVGGLPLARWYNWDAAWYLRVAGNGPQMGYSRFTADVHHFNTFAFFPLYPLAVRAAALVVPGALDPVQAGGQVRPQLLVVALVVSNVLFVLALLALYLLTRGRAGPAAARRAVWLLCLFPTTIFFSAPYSESLFLLWLVLFFLMLERRQWWLAALCGALASATRSLGVGLMLPYLVAYWLDRRAGARLIPVLLIPLGLLGYMLFQWLAWGDPLLFQEAERAWQRSLALPWVGIVDGLSWSLRGWPHLTQPQWRGLTDALYAAAFVGLTALAWRDLDWVERAYAVVFWLYVLCEPQISDPAYPDTLISMARFLLVLLPLWLWLARSRARTWLMALPSALALLFYAARWVNHGWIG